MRAKRHKTGDTPAPNAERLLDLAIEFTFPASDPIAVDHAFRAAVAGAERRRSQEAVAVAKARRAAKSTKR